MPHSSPFFLAHLSLTSRSQWLFLFITINLLCANPVFAIVNMENLHLGTAPDGFSGQFDFAASGASGNSRKTVTSIGNRLQWRQDKTTAFLVLDYTYGKSLGKTDTNRGFLHARYLYDYHEHRTWEVFSQVQRNEFTRLSLRSLLGAGNRITLMRQADKKIALLGTGLFFETEDLDEKAGTNDDTSINAWRANIYLILKYKLNNTLSFQNSAYYQPDIQDFSDFRFIEIATLKIKLTNKLSLKLNINIAHDGQPPQSVEKTDVNYTTGISYQF